MNSRQIEYLRLVTTHQAAIHGYIRSLAPQASADDILQETNIVLWEKAEAFEPGTRFMAFAFRIAHLKTLEALRRHKRKHWLVFDSDLLESIASHSQPNESNDDLAEKSQEALRRCLAELDEPDRELLHRRYTRRETVREISRVNQCTEGSLQQLFFRLRNQLRTCIERRLAVEGGGS